ncbi:thiamine phosphate synthase [Sediminibacterium soli]|uniref:thiamine phosphate synthase n=1 Tax=Sediminibacterium soli TaxID=2698829 RepID=UPI00137ACA2C|nr:thiamine phosphate synthase [Sediminibacterium soli]NCI46414.1 thiamine phosphate synthase [Sediminibacterium soli]
MHNRLQYISQGRDLIEHLENIREALDGGCQWIQLRLKKANEKEILATAEKARRLCLTYGATFIINDHVAIAKAIDADGVHLGLEDMPVSKARIILGDAKIIGGTANTFEQVRQRCEEGCRYIGVGPFRFTATKDKLSPILGTGGYERILSRMKQEQLTVPVFAIGGILPADIPAILQTGVYGIAVSGVISRHFRKNQIITQLNHLLYGATDHR